MMASTTLTPFTQPQHPLAGLKRRCCTQSALHERVQDEQEYKQIPLSYIHARPYLHGHGIYQRNRVLPAPPICFGRVGRSALRPAESRAKVCSFRPMRHLLLQREPTVECLCAQANDRCPPSQNSSLCRCAAYQPHWGLRLSALSLDSTKDPAPCKQTLGNLALCAHHALSMRHMSCSSLHISMQDIWACPAQSSSIPT